MMICVQILNIDHKPTFAFIAKPVSYAYWLVYTKAAYAL